MGKKAKTASGKAKAERRKVDKGDLPAPPPPLKDELGSLRPVDKCSLPGSNYKLIGIDGFDDGGVGDLALLVDLDDMALRRKRGEADYQAALRADLLPRSKAQSLAEVSRRDQKVHLAQTLFAEDDEAESKGPSEVWQDRVNGDESEMIVNYRLERLRAAKQVLGLSLVLREPSCSSLCLSEISKRTLAYRGKEGAEDALRLADKALEIAGDGFWDSDDILVECKETAEHDPKFEKNATSPGLAHPTTLKLLPLRVSHLCTRSAKLQRGNCLAAFGREEDARAMYLDVVAAMEGELRCSRADWERHSAYINIANTYSREGNSDQAEKYYNLAEELGKDHVEGNGGSEHDGKGMINSAKRWRAFALKKAGKEEDAKVLMREVIHAQIQLDKEAAEIKKRDEAEQAKSVAEEQLEAMQEAA